MLGTLDNLYIVDKSKQEVTLNFLAHMFSEKHSDFAFKHRHLWSCFKIWYVSDDILKHKV